MWALRFGRDHADVGDFFDLYAVRVLWTRGLSSYGIDRPPHEVDRGLIGGLGLGLFCWGILPIVSSAAGGLS